VREVFIRETKIETGTVGRVNIIRDIMLETGTEGE